MTRERQLERGRRRGGRVRQERIDLAHGGGGKAMRDLIDDVVQGAFGAVGLDTTEDQARISLSSLSAAGDRLAFSTDSYVVRPLRFPDASAGHLAVHGTVNDLAMMGARPLALSAAFVIEEGLSVETLREIVADMAHAAAAAVTAEP